MNEYAAGRANLWGAMVHCPEDPSEDRKSDSKCLREPERKPLPDPDPRFAVIFHEDPVKPLDPEDWEDSHDEQMADK